MCYFQQLDRGTVEALKGYAKQGAWSRYLYLFAVLSYFWGILISIVSGSMAVANYSFSDLMTSLGVGGVLLLLGMVLQIAGFIWHIYGILLLYIIFQKKQTLPINCLPL